MLTILTSPFTYMALKDNDSLGDTFQYNSILFLVLHHSTIIPQKMHHKKMQNVKHLEH
jgi:hypothetical protein